MNKTTAETQDTVTALITVETAENMRSVKLYVRESVNCQVVGEAEITVSPDTFYDLVQPVLKEMGYNTQQPAGGV